MKNYLKNSIRKHDKLKSSFSA
jgi:hypothetical protein